MALIWKTILVVIAIITSLLDRMMKKIIKKRRVPLPPSPKGFPVLGHLHLLGKNPHQDLHKLSKQHGPIMMIFGKKYTNEEFGNKKGFEGVIQEAMQLAAKPNLGDYFPYLGKLDLQGLTVRFKAASAVFEAFLEKVLDEHEQQSSRGQESRETQEGKNMHFVDTMLGILNSGQAEFTFDWRHVRAILLDMLIGAMDTSATVIEWTMSKLLRHPTTMKNVQSELEQLVGLNRIVEESDIGNLQYLNMVVKESMRLHPVAPLLIPHNALEYCTVEGYHIPKRSRVIINAWSIGRDPEAWSDPEKFIPERFEGSKLDVRGRDFQLMSFGSGKKGLWGRLGCIEEEGNFILIM